MTLRLWLLKLNEEHIVWDGCTGHVIRASSESMARNAAAAKASDEGSDVWLNPKESTCEHIKVNNFDPVTEIILTQTRDG